MLLIVAITDVVVVTKSNPSKATIKIAINDMTMYDPINNNTPEITSSSTTFHPFLLFVFSLDVIFYLFLF